MRLVKLTVILVGLLSMLACSTRVDYERRVEAATNDLLDVNVATAAELERLPGIGLAKAKAILDHRGEHGPFRRIEHLMLVEDIGEKSFLEIRPLIRVQ